MSRPHVQLCATILLACGCAFAADTIGDASAKRMIDQIAPDADAFEPPLLEIEWQSLHASASLDVNTMHTNRSARLNGKVLFPDDERVIGVGHRVTINEVIDEHGRNIYAEEDPARWRSSYDTRRRRPHMNRIDDPPRTQLSCDLSNLTRLPRHIQRIEGRVSMLIMRRHKIVEFEISDPPEDWVELAPGMRIQFTEMSIENGRGKISCRYESDYQGQFRFFGSINNDGQLSRPFVVDAWLDDNEGREWSIGLGGGGHQNADGVFEGTAGSSFSGSNVDQYKTYKMMISLEAEEVTQPIVVTDLPFPRYEIPENDPAEEQNDRAEDEAP